jgi:hypothetical protein
MHKVAACEPVHLPAGPGAASAVPTHSLHRHRHHLVCLQEGKLELDLTGDKISYQIFFNNYLICVVGSQITLSLYSQTLSSIRQLLEHDFRSSLQGFILVRLQLLLPCHGVRYP